MYSNPNSEQFFCGSCIFLAESVSLQAITIYFPLQTLRLDTHKQHEGVEFETTSHQGAYIEVENSEDHNFSNSSCSGPVNPSLDRFDFDTAIEQVAKCGLLPDHAGGSFLGRPVLYDVQN